MKVWFTCSGKDNYNIKYNIIELSFLAKKISQLVLLGGGIVIWWPDVVWINVVILFL